MKKVQCSPVSFSPKSYNNVKLQGTYKIGFEGAEVLLGDLAGKSVLDYGCGPGRSTYFLHQLNGATVGVDISSKMVELAAEQLPFLEFKVLNKEMIPYENDTFDIAFSSFVYTGLPNTDCMTKINTEIYRVLKSQGKFLILTVNPDMWGNNYESCSSDFPDDFTGSSGDRVNVWLKEDPPIAFQDFYWKEQDYIQSLEIACFIVESISKPSGNEDLCEIPPYLLIMSRKL